MHQLVHWSHEAHDLHHLTASDLFGIVKLNQVEVLPSEFRRENVVVEVHGFACYPIRSWQAKDKKRIIKPCGHVH